MSGGETTLGDSRLIPRHIAPSVLDEFKRKKIRYIRNLTSERGDGYSWQDAFETNEKGQVEAICKVQGIEFQWRSGDDLSLMQTGPATTHHPATGDEVWFNQAEGFHWTTVCPEGSSEAPRLNSMFADGTEIPIDHLINIRSALTSATIRHGWKKGELLFIDNRLTAHGRLPFCGPRRILLAMT